MPNPLNKRDRKEVKQEVDVAADEKPHEYQ